MKRKKLILVEEIFNSVTHGIGAVASIVGLVFLILIARDGGALKITSYIIFGATLILLYVMSTLFHSLTYTKAQKVFLIFDRSAVFLLIAGTYTPISLLLLHGWLGWTLLSVIWSIAICGIVFNGIFAEKYKWVYNPLYLLMGWIGLFFILKPLLATLSVYGVWLLVIGGLAYTVGVVFHNWNKLPFNHTIWHVFVMVGSFCHFMIIYSL
jgi:hemolysin III